MIDRLTVHEFPPILDMQPSSFGLKLETWLRMIDQSYDVKWSFTKLGPKKKVPFVVLDGTPLGDSELIIQQICAQSGRDPDSHLTQEARKQSLFIRRLVEEHFYFILVYSRWQDAAVWPEFSRRVFASVPFPLRPLIKSRAQKAVMGMLHAQGISRHSPDEIYAKAVTDLECLSVELGARSFFVGETPTVADASVYGILANVLYQPLDTRLGDELRKFQNLCEYCDRVKALYWPEAKYGGGEGAQFRPQNPTQVSALKSA